MDVWNKWLEETSRTESELIKHIGGHISIGMDGVQLDGGFTPSELRKIADAVEKRIKAIEWED